MSGPALKLVSGPMSIARGGDVGDWWLGVREEVSSGISTSAGLDEDATFLETLWLCIVWFLDDVYGEVLGFGCPDLPLLELP